jgi:hypothetical protein
VNAFIETFHLKYSLSIFQKPVPNLIRETLLSCTLDGRQGTQQPLTMGIVHWRDSGLRAFMFQFFSIL